MEEITKIIDDLVKEIVDTLSKELSYCLESITLLGSYTLGKISLERPNVNFLIFAKPNVSANDYLKLGEIFYRVSEKYLNYFSIKIDSLPFRTGFPMGDKELQLIFTPNVVNITQKNDSPPFGIPLNVLEGMKSTRKVAFGSDPLKKIDIKYSKQDVIKWAFFDIGVLFRNYLIRAPLTYNTDKHFDLLADESLEIGKIALIWGTEIFLNEKDYREQKHIELIKDKEKMIEFYHNIDKKLGEDAKIILDARLQFRQYKTNKEKTFQLYNSAYNLINRVFFKILEEIKQ